MLKMAAHPPRGGRPRPASAAKVRLSCIYAEGWNAAGRRRHSARSIRSMRLEAAKYGSHG